jgi:hypothetical protein
MDVVEPAPLSGPYAPRLDPQGPLVAGAIDLLARHTADPDRGICRACMNPYPCQARRDAKVVCLAAGVDLESLAATTTAA